MTIIFVCTGNTCRSPMAEAIAKYIYKDKINVLSRGIYADNISPINEKSNIILNKNNIDFNNHISKTLTVDDLKNADLILTMEKQHKNLINDVNIDENISDKVFTIYEYVSNVDKDILDPYGFDISVYESCFSELYNLISKINFNISEENI